MSVNITLEGMEELKRALRELPETFTGEAGHIVEASANAAAYSIRASYVVGPTGKLRAGVGMDQPSRAYQAVAIVRSRAKHAHLYEWGTKARTTKTGANRGTMPARKVFIPAVMRERARMVEALVALVERAGFRVERSP